MFCTGWVAPDIWHHRGAEDEGARRGGSRRAFEIGTHAPLGEFVNPLALRKNVTGWVMGPGDVYWNVKKNGD